MIVYNPKFLFLKIIFFNSNFDGGKFLVPNKLGEGIFIDEGKEEPTNKSNRTGLIVGVDTFKSFYLPITSEKSEHYSKNYADGMFLNLSLNNLKENSLKNNSILHTDNIIAISNKKLIEMVNNKTLIFKSIFINDISDGRSILPLKIIWDLYNNFNIIEKRNLISINEIIDENFGKKEKSIFVNNKEFKYIRMAKTLAITKEQVDDVFSNIKDNNRSLFNDIEYYKNYIVDNKEAIENEYKIEGNYFKKSFVKYIDKKLNELNKNDDERWLNWVESNKFLDFKNFKNEYKKCKNEQVINNKYNEKNVHNNKTKYIDTDNDNVFSIFKRKNNNERER